MFCCPSGDNIIGYIKKIDNKKDRKNYYYYNDDIDNEIKFGRYIYYGSNLYVKYPNLNYEQVSEEEYKNGFQKINQNVKGILAEKNTNKFKEQICCKLCNFNVSENVEEFKEHLNSKIHKEKMEELKKEFLF